MSRYLIALLLFITAEAHNWVSTMSRVPRAATTFPCMAKRTALPHVQLGLGQLFQVEWAMGHSSDVYFTLLRAEDSDFMQEHTRNLLDDYISAAPAGAEYIHGDVPGSSVSARSYRRTNSMDGCHRDDNDNTLPASDIYESQLLPGDKNYLERPAAFADDDLNRIRNNDNQGYMWEYYTADRPDDSVVIYNNPDYPWIKGVWRYEITQDCASEVDVALFWIPNPQPGDYILHYKWRGYYDCIDINVLDQTTPTAFPYGERAAEGEEGYYSRRVDHCYHPIMSYRGVPWEVFGANGHEVCVAQCINRFEEGCDGVNVLPYGLGRRDFGRHWDPVDNFINHEMNLTFYESGDTYTESPLDGHDADPPDFSGREMLIDYYEDRLAAGDDPLVCVPLFAHPPTTTTDKYVISDDPLDPVWYSTCYEIVKVIKFIGYPLPGGNSSAGENSAPLGDWKIMGRCIDCEQRYRNTQNRVPTWELVAEDECRNCDREPEPTIPDPFPAIMMSSGYCNLDSGTHPDCGSSSVCQKDIRREAFDIYDSTGTKVIDSGKSVPNAEACGEIAARDPECGSYFSFGYSSSGSVNYCYCNRIAGNGAECCADVCHTRETSNTRWAFTHDLTWGTTPDPDCTNGVLSDTSQQCCSAGCGSCTADSTADDGDVCRTSRIPSARLCTTHGAPCHMAGSPYIDAPEFNQEPRP